MAFVYRTSFLEWRTLAFVQNGETETLEVQLEVPQMLALFTFEKRIDEVSRMSSAEALEGYGALLCEVVKDWKLRDEKGKPVPVNAQTLANVFCAPDLVIALNTELTRAALRLKEEREGNSEPSATGGPAPTAAASGPVATAKQSKRATRA